MKFKKKSQVAVPCASSLVFDVLTDYDSYSAWMPQIAASKLLAREGDLAIAEFKLAGGERLVVECIHTKNEMVLNRKISGNLPLFQLEWGITEAQEGRSELTLSIEGQAGWRRLFHKYRQFAEPKKTLKAFQSYSSSYSAGGQTAGEKGEKVMEIVETDQGFVFWIRGKKYTLKAAAEGEHE